MGPKANDDDDDSVSAMDLLAQVQHRMESQRHLQVEKETSRRNLRVDSSSPRKSIKPASVSSPEEKKDEAFDEMQDELRGEDDKNEEEEEGAVEEEDEEEEDEEEEDEDEEDKEDDLSAGDLLEAVKGRMEQQKFMDEVKDLRKQLADKDDEINVLKAQLQMAISTKHSLLIANSELEQQHQQDLEQSVRFEEDMQRSSRVHMNIRAEIEKDFLNDMLLMGQKLQAREEELSKKEDMICKLEAQLTQKRIREEQCTDCIEKDETIRLLQEKVHKLEKIAPKQETDKVKFYKAKLGL